MNIPDTTGHQMTV